MTHKESEEFSKHNDDVEIVVGKTGVRPCEREKRGQKGKRCVGARMLVTDVVVAVQGAPGGGRLVYGAHWSTCSHHTHCTLCARRAAFRAHRMPYVASCMI